MIDTQTQRSPWRLSALIALLFLGLGSPAQAQLSGWVVEPLSDLLVDYNEKVLFAGYVNEPDKAVFLWRERDGEGITIQFARSNSEIDFLMEGGEPLYYWSAEYSFGFQPDEVRDVVWVADDQRANVIRAKVVANDLTEFERDGGKVITAHVRCGKADQPSCGPESDCDVGYLKQDGVPMCEEAPDRPADPPPPEEEPESSGRWWAVSCLCDDGFGGLGFFSLNYCYGGTPNANSVCPTYVTETCVGAGVEFSGSNETCSPGEWRE